MAKRYQIAPKDQITFLSEDLTMPYLITSVRQGIGYANFERMVAFTSFTLSEWSSILHLTERSLLRYKTQNQTFDPLQSEKIIQIMLLFKKGIEVLGSKTKFDSWMQSRSVALGGIHPKEVLDSSFGITWLIDELGRIEHGILA